MSITERELAENHHVWMVSAQQAAEPLDMAQLLLSAYDLGDSINQSAEVAEYLYWKQAVENDNEVAVLKAKFFKAKELFDECQRFGRFHPDYHAAKDGVKAIQQEMDALECVRSFKEAENAVDTLLHEVATLIAGAVSDTIKVPGNDAVAGGCGGGGSCSCGSGGCG